ncbi:uncharacterized protein K460DRAFT_404948 [Cucurbitaria berberidis CBS 394.84]|uniref:Myb-like domain-containing protein n=1 Tax=Cucurbitaria berberidis CBS 394.84 TaxID=1168544 RepID=A0A9P4GFL6_9PLEO|nr:uncharacterized protein K460DRAFT_404948 [Cucurbitaria berberidis CBS 394.84]KAF1844665.1 hypothetical protein K460DRAFT_404948 [Cucurbitaria berberidis CBS 394.84]
MSVKRVKPEAPPGGPIHPTQKPMCGSSVCLVHLLELNVTAVAGSSPQFTAVHRSSAHKAKPALTMMDLSATPTSRSTSPIVDINLLLEPRGSESPASKKSSGSVASNSTAATRPYTIAPSAYTQSPAHGTSPAYATGSPAYALPPYGPISAYPAQAPTSGPHGPGPMLGGPVLPAIAELQRHSDPAGQPQFRPLYSGPPGPPTIHQGLPGTNGSPPSALKRQASQTPLPEESPAKKQSKWTPEEDNLTIELRGQGMKWDDIAKRLPGRSSISCRLRYQNYLEKRAIWDEEKKNKLARLYARFKDQMWQKVATEMGIPWRSAESMHWQLGEQEMSARANAPVFQLHPSATGTGISSPSQMSAVPAPAQQGFTPANTAQLMPNPPPMPTQHHQPPPPLPQGPIHGYHRRTDSGSSAERRNSSFSRRRADPRSRSSVPPQLGQPLPQIHAASEEDLVSGARTAPVPDMYSGIKREGSSYIEPYQRKRREEEAVGPPRSELEARSQGGRSPDRLSQRSGTGSVKSMKREPEEVERTSAVPSPPSATS